MNTTSLITLAAICTMLVSCRVADPMPAFQIVTGTYACTTCDTFGVTGLSLEETQRTGRKRDVYVVYQLPSEPRRYAYGESFMVQPQDTGDTVGLHRIADSLVTASIDKPRCSMYRRANVGQLERSDTVLGTFHLENARHYPEDEYAPTTLAVALRNIEAVVPASTLPRSTKLNAPLILGVVFVVSLLVGLFVNAVNNMWKGKSFGFPSIPRRER